MYWYDALNGVSTGITEGLGTINAGIDRQRAEEDRKRKIAREAQEQEWARQQHEMAVEQHQSQMHEYHQGQADKLAQGLRDSAKSMMDSGNAAGVAAIRPQYFSAYNKAHGTNLVGSGAVGRPMFQPVMSQMSGPMPAGQARPAPFQSGVDRSKRIGTDFSGEDTQRALYGDMMLEAPKPEYKAFNPGDQVHRINPHTHAIDPKPAFVVPPTESMADKVYLAQVRGNIQAAQHEAAATARATATSQGQANKTAPLVTYHANELMQMFPHAQMTSSFRTHEEQQALWTKALHTYGSAEVARRYVAPPGSSSHENGTGIDVVVPSPQIPAFRAEAQRRGFYVYDETDSKLGSHLHLDNRNNTLLPMAKAQPTTLDYHPDGTATVVGRTPGTVVGTRSPLIRPMTIKQITDEVDATLRPEKPDTTFPPPAEVKAAYARKRTAMIQQRIAEEAAKGAQGASPTAAPAQKPLSDILKEAGLL